MPSDPEQFFSLKDINIGLQSWFRSIFGTLPPLWWGGQLQLNETVVNLLLCFSPLFHCEFTMYVHLTLFHCFISHPFGWRCIIVPLFHLFHCSMCCTVHCLCTHIHDRWTHIYAMNCQDKTMSVWLQALGEFFWVFLMNEANDLEVYKIMGETEMLDEKAVDLVHAF